MHSDLDLLIDQYQWESVRLKKAIEDNLEMHFYREVELDEKALGEVQKELDILLELKNPYYPKIKRLKGQIQSLEKRKGNSTNDDFYYSYFFPKIKKAQSELSNLERHIVNSYVVDTQLIDEALILVIKKSISGFKIYLRVEDDSYILVTLHTESSVIISLVAHREDLFWLKKYSVVKYLNFTFNESENKLQSEFFLAKRNNILPIKEFLSRIVLGLKKFSGAQKTTYLEYLKT